jgi:hypothetical protein
MDTYFIHALFRSEPSAARAVRALVDAHFASEEISALMRVDDRVEELHVEHSTVNKGALIGAALGAVGGALAATGMGLLAAGPLLAAAEGALIFGSAGTAAGALSGLNRWKDEITFPPGHEGEMILVGVSTSDARLAAARDALAATHPECIHVASKAEACREVATGMSSAGATGVAR